MQLTDQNILFIVRTMGVGGTENVVLQLCEILMGRVNKIIVCSSGGVHERKLKELGIRHYTNPDIASKRPLDMLKTYFNIKNIIKEERITIVHSHHRMAALFAELIAPKGVLKVANAHNTFQDKKILTHFAYHNTKVIAVGEMVKKNLVTYFALKNEQVYVIHNAVKPFDGNIQSIELFEKEHAAEHILIGNIGRLSEQKGMFYFIEAAEITIKRHPEAHFVIVGEGELRKQLDQLVNSRNLQDKITFLGYRGDIQNVMSQLDFIVLSSLWEGLPLTPIEAFSVGKTVIGTAVDGTPEIIKDGVNGYLVEPRNKKQLAEKMDYLLEHSEVRKKMEKEASNCYQTEFSFKMLSQRYLEFYEEL